MIRLGEGVKQDNGVSIKQLLTKTEHQIQNIKSLENVLHSLCVSVFVSVLVLLNVGKYLF